MNPNDSGNYYNDWLEYEDDAAYAKKLMNTLISAIYGNDAKQPADYAYKLEGITSLHNPSEINNIMNRNSDKFDNLTDQGYKLDLTTGIFYKLSA